MPRTKTPTTHSVVELHRIKYDPNPLQSAHEHAIAIEAYLELERPGDPDNPAGDALRQAHAAAVKLVDALAKLRKEQRR